MPNEQACQNTNSQTDQAREQILKGFTTVALV